jgi:hypothetical protein
VSSAARQCHFVFYVRHSQDPLHLLFVEEARVVLLFELPNSLLLLSARPSSPFSLAQGPPNNLVKHKGSAVHCKVEKERFVTGLFLGGKQLFNSLLDKVPKTFQEAIATAKQFVQKWQHHPRYWNERYQQQPLDPSSFRFPHVALPIPIARGSDKRNECY